MHLPGVDTAAVTQRDGATVQEGHLQALTGQEGGLPEPRGSSVVAAGDTGGGLEGHGLILEHPEAKIARFAEEHGFLDLARSNTRPVVGDVVRIVPNHVCVVVNMMDEVVMVRGDEIIGILPVAARGKLR